jgi:glycosidase
MRHTCSAILGSILLSTWCGACVSGPPSTLRLDAAVPNVVPRSDAGSPASTDAAANEEEETPAQAAERIAAEERRSAVLTARPDVHGWRRRVIYFVLVDRFRNGAPERDDAHGHDVCNDADNAHTYQGGDLAGLREHLDYIQELGADALWITPLYRGVPAMAGSNCGFPGYWADFADPYSLELDPRFGAAEDLDALLEAMHGRDMPLMLDMVVNHAGYGARIVSQRPDWFTDPSTCASQGDPEIFCSLAGLPDFDQRVPAVRSYLTNLHRSWVERFDIDAIRMDTVKHVTPSYFGEWNAAMREARPDMYVIGELLNEHDLAPLHPYLDEGGFDGLFNFPLRRALIDTFALGHSVDVAASRMAETLDRFGQARAGAMVNLLDNHDVRRFVEEIPGGVSGADAQARYHLAMTALLTLPGVPQIYYGNELGMYGGHDPDNRRFMPDWAFDPAERSSARRGFLPQPARVFEHTQRLLRIRSSVAALSNGEYVELWRQNGAHHNNVWAYLRHRGESRAIVVHNNGLRETDGAVPIGVRAHFADGVVFTDVLDEAGIESVRVEGGTLRVRLPAQSSVILVPNEVPDAVSDRVTVRFEAWADTRPSESVFLTGSAAVLGAWDLAEARPMSPSRCEGTRCLWVTEVTLHASARVEHKLVAIERGPRVRWEAGPNRILEAGETATVTMRFRE